EASTAALNQALRSFPSVLPLLAKKLDIALPPAIRARRDCKSKIHPGPLTSRAAASEGGAGGGEGFDVR
ncbi:hypothetical protein FPV67DRAFT_1529537, partial [Lyophyllum atratum]